MATTHCTSVGREVSTQRPFSNLPAPLQAVVAGVLDRALRVCATAGFEEIQCAGGDTDACKPCWRLEPADPAYYVCGLTRLDLSLSAQVPAIGSKALAIEVEIAVADVGYRVDTESGHGYLQTTGSCPTGCENMAISGRLAIELTGRLIMSSELLEYWNKSCILGLIEGILSNEPDDTLDLIESDFVTEVKQGRFAVEIAGTGRAGGAVFDVGPFDLTPP